MIPDKAVAELAQARALLTVNARAAGAVCGVALERALVAVAGGGAGSLGPLGARLRVAGLLPPDLHLLVKYVAKTRARCVHALPTPTAAQVERMIARSYQVVAALAERGDS